MTVIKNFKRDKRKFKIQQADPEFKFSKIGFNKIKYLADQNFSKTSFSASL